MNDHYIILSSHGWGLSYPHFSHPDCVCTGWFRQLISARPFQSFTVCILNDYSRLRMEFIPYNHFQTLIFESRVVKIWIQDTRPLCFTSRLSVVLTDGWDWTHFSARVSLAWLLRPNNLKEKISKWHLKEFLHTSIIYLYFHICRQKWKWRFCKKVICLWVSLTGHSSVCFE